MCVASAEIAELIKLAAARGVMLAPFHSRRWDSDFLTLKKLLQDGSARPPRLLRVHHGPLASRAHGPDALEERSRAGRPARSTSEPILPISRSPSSETPKPIDAEIKRERDGEGANDCFTLRLRYPGFTVVLSANTLSAIERPRYHLRGTKGNYVKRGVDPQEAALGKITRIARWPLGSGTCPPTGEPSRLMWMEAWSRAPLRPSPATTASTTQPSATPSSERPRAGLGNRRLACSAASRVGRGKLGAALRNCLRLERDAEVASSPPAGPRPYGPLPQSTVILTRERSEGEESAVAVRCCKLRSKSPNWRQFLRRPRCRRGFALEFE